MKRYTVENLFPANLPAFPGFVDLVVSFVNTLVEEGFEYQNLMPWNLFHDVEDNEDQENITFKNYKSLMRLFISYLEVSIPQRIVEVSTLCLSLDKLLKRSKYRNHDGPKAIELRSKIKQIEYDTPDILWDDAEKTKEGQSEWSGFHHDNLKNDDFVESILYWTILNYADFYKIKPRFSHKYLKYMTKDMRAWRPLFSKQYVTNEFMCTHIDFIPELAKGKSVTDIFDPDINNDDDRLSFFLSEGQLLGNWGWVISFRDWGYTRESAREFFGVDGFLSNLYNQSYLAINNDKTFMLWINEIVLPEFDSIWPAE